MKQTVRLIILGIMATAVIVTSAFAMVYIRFGRDANRHTDQGTPAAYTLGVWEGQLAVFEGDAAFPNKLYEVPISALPSAEQEKLRQGIVVQTIDELQLLLEDYTS